MALIFISQHLERGADHSVNIAEEAIYMVQGRDVRHPRTPKERPPTAAEPGPEHSR
jgi:phosphate uptake regulator